MKLPLHLLLCPSVTSLLPSLPQRLHHRPITSLNYKPTDEDIFNILANTEKWISDTLDKTNESARKAQGMHYAEDATPDPLSEEEKAASGSNPYARKEVTYACETGEEICGVLGGIFRRVREARELGERHGAENDGATTMRQTNVVVIPNCSELSEFKTFDKMVQAINMARRHARDFNFKKEETDNKDWVVSINCAHLHPQYGELSPEEQLEAMKLEEEAGEVDLNLQAYKKRRNEARRSPYPSVIVEVMSTPPPEYTSPRMTYIREEGEEQITNEDIARLNALLNLNAASTKKDGDFYDALGEAFADKSYDAHTPLSKGQNWVLQNDPLFDQATSTFTTSDTRHVDKAYEYVFNTIAMILSQTPKQGQRSYIVLPEFLPNSSFSFDRFAEMIANILNSVPSMQDKTSISTFHPEHIEAMDTSPVPILVVTWNWSYWRPTVKCNSKRDYLKEMKK